MLRDVTMEEISDGKLYRADDLVKADCHDCKGSWENPFCWILTMFTACRRG